MAVTAYPSWAYNATAPAQIVASAAAFAALGAGWQQTPFANLSVNAPADPGLTDTDIRLQQILIELRIVNQLLYANAVGISDDPQLLRADVIATDVGLAT